METIKPKTLTIWREGNNLGSEIHDEKGGLISWSELIRAEQLDFLTALVQWKDFFLTHLKQQ